jgi:uncharacterized protein (TIGR02271 family)
MTQTLVAMFDSRDDAARARERLLAEGVRDADITLQAGDARDSASATGTTPEESGGIGSWFRSLFGMDDTDEHVVLHDEAARRGATTLTVEARDAAQADRALAVLRAAGAIDLDARAQQWRSEGWQAGALGTGPGTTAGTDAQARAARAAGTVAGGTDVYTTDARGTTRTADTRDAGTTERLPVVEEALAIGRRVVQRGGIRVVTRIVETPVEEDVRLREEHAEVHRHKVDRPATEADLQSMREGTIEVRETTEEPVVAKRARVVEEVDVGKRVSERTETVKDTIRHTEVNVDQVGADERTARESAMASRGKPDPDAATPRDPEVRGTGRRGRRDA